MKYSGITVAHLATLLLAIGACVSPTSRSIGQETTPKQREQIGEAQGKPVYRDEIRTGKGTSLQHELHRLFTTAAGLKYREAHKAELEPTEKELDFTQEFMDKKHRERRKNEEPQLRNELQQVEKDLAKKELTNDQVKKLKTQQSSIELRLRPPNRSIAIIMLNNLKFQQHLYHKYGGGRVLWQQAGIEAFDAMHQWLQSLEKQGEFQITDPKLRATLYEYWTTMKHGGFLTGDPKRVREELLAPEWALSEDKDTEK